MALKISVMRMITDVDEAAVEAGEAAQRRPDNEGRQHPDEADGEADAATGQNPGEQVAAQIVAAQQEDLSLPGVEQVRAAVYSPPEAVAFAPGEEPDRMDLVGVLGIDALEGFEVEFELEAVHEWAAESPFAVDQADAGGRGIHEAFVLGDGAVGRPELVGEGHQIKGQQHEEREYAEPVLAEAAPDQLPLRGDEQPVLGRQRRRDGFGTHCAPFSIRMRGS